MSIRDVSKPESIEQAIEEFDRLGREAFLEKYGFGKAREYYLFKNGKYYDSKAIVGVAHGFEFPQRGPLKFDQFTGGDKTVRKKLELLGFIVRVNTQEPLVLTENEVTFEGRYDHWQDATGERYHFPNQYKGLIISGRPFVYYRGSRRKKGKRQIPEYFGYGRIGEVWLDDEYSPNIPKKNRKWFCSIDDYMPFNHPVPFKIKEKTIEEIPLSQFRSGVRILSRESLKKILTLGKISPEIYEKESTIPNFPEASDVKPQIVGENETLLKATLSSRPSGQAQGNSFGSSVSRRSKYSQLIGDWAEEVVFNELHRAKAKYKEIQNVSKENKGWDLECRDMRGNIFRIEVKGTRGVIFPNVEITANEWQKAEEYGESYYLYLVTNCGNINPKIKIIQDPYKAFSNGSLSAVPLLWRIGLICNGKN